MPGLIRMNYSTSIAVVLYCTGRGYLGFLAKRESRGTIDEGLPVRGSEPKDLQGNPLDIFFPDSFLFAALTVAERSY